MQPISGTPAAAPSSVPAPTQTVSLKQNSENTASDKAGESIVIRHSERKDNPLPISDSVGFGTPSYTEPSLQVRSAAGPNTATAINTEPKMLAEGVYIGEGRAESGEKVFLRMERVTLTNKPLWEKYLQNTQSLTLDTRSALTYAMRHTKKIKGADGEVCFINDQFRELEKSLGLSEKEFNTFINLIGKNGFYWAPENKARIKSLTTTYAGANHLRLDTGGQHYVVYASKTAQFQIPGGNDILAISDPLTLKQYNDLYNNLLICVGVDFPDGDYMHSKGMFRNPTSTIEKTHKGLSMVLRGFSGAVAQKFFPGKNSLSCKPLSSMQYMISSSLQPEDYSVVGRSHEQVLSEAADSLRDGNVFEMPNTSIKLSALDRFYRNHASTTERNE